MAIVKVDKLKLTINGKEMEEVADGNEIRVNWPIKFRFHRGGLEESMETIIEVKDLNEIVKFLKAKEPGAYVGFLSCKYYGFDDRINWDTWIVLDDGYPLGFSDGELK